MAKKKHKKPIKHSNAKRSVKDNGKEISKSEKPVVAINKKSPEQDSDSDLEALVEQTLGKMKTAAGLFAIDRKPINIEKTQPQTDGKYESEADCDDNEDMDTIEPVKMIEKVIPKKMTLSSQLDPGSDFGGSYLMTDVLKAPQKRNTNLQALAIKEGKHDTLMKKSVIPEGVEKQFMLPEYEQSLHQQRKQSKAERERTKGKGWFNMEAPEMTEEKKNDLMVLQMRNVLDPKRFYKAPDIRALPKYFEMGRIQESAADFYSSRVPKKQRKKTLVDELLADDEFRKFNKRKYTEIQESKMKGTGAYKRMKRLKKKKK